MSHYEPYAMPELPPLPPLPDDLLASVSSLVGAARLFRGVAMLLVEKTPLQEVLEEHEQNLLLADQVLEVWEAHVGSPLE